MGGILEATMGHISSRVEQRALCVEQSRITNRLPCHKDGGQTRHPSLSCWDSNDDWQYCEKQSPTLFARCRGIEKTLAVHAAPLADLGQIMARLVARAWRSKLVCERWQRAIISQANEDGQQEQGEDGRTIWILGVEGNPIGHCLPCVTSPTLFT